MSEGRAEKSSVGARPPENSSKETGTFAKQPSSTGPSATIQIPTVTIRSTVLPSSTGTAQRETTVTAAKETTTTGAVPPATQPAVAGFHPAALPIAPQPFVLQANQVLNPLLKNGAAAMNLPSLPLAPSIVAPAHSFLLHEQSHHNSKKLRSGKWIPEEEEYSKLLIELFEKGMIRDCENGTTLRAYLSHKLQCAPMRISKKYAGKGIGKMTYSAKLHGATYDMTVRLEQAEKRYMEAIHPPKTALFPSVLPLVHPVTFLHGSLLAGRPHQVYPAAAVAPGSAPAISIPSTASATKALVTGAIPSVSSAAVPTPVVGHTKQLHESFMKALQQTAGTAAPVVAALQQGAPTNATVVPQPATSLQQVSNAAPHAVVPIKQEPAGHVVTNNGLPDFLAGFDKITQSASAVSAANTAVPSEPEAGPHSPPFTSRSFDDFHQLLGKDLTPLGSESQTDNKKAKSTTFHDTTALFTADSYAVFAQESAVEASQHAAYVLEQQQHHASNKREVDLHGVLELVSEHTMAPNKSTDRRLPQTTLRKRQSALVSEPTTESSGDGGTSSGDTESEASDGPKPKKARMGKATRAMA